MESGSRVILKCVISNWLLKPNVVVWYRGDDRLLDGYDGVVTTRQDYGPSHARGAAGPLKGPLSGPSIVAQLTINRAGDKHSGVYKCSPDNILQPATVKLHVIKGECDTSL